MVPQTLIFFQGLSLFLDTDVEWRLQLPREGSSLFIFFVLICVLSFSDNLRNNNNQKGRILAKLNFNAEKDAEITQEFMMLETWWCHHRYKEYTYVFPIPQCKGVTEVQPEGLCKFSRVNLFGESDLKAERIKTNIPSQ